MGEKRAAVERGFKKKELEGVSLADGSFLKALKTQRISCFSY